MTYTNQMLDTKLGTDLPSNPNKPFKKWKMNNDAFSHSDGYRISSLVVVSHLRNMGFPYNIILPEQIGFWDESQLESLLNYIRTK